jgi:hypothetical protein
VNFCPQFHFCGSGDLFEAGYSAIEISEKADRSGDIFALFGDFSSGLVWLNATEYVAVRNITVLSDPGFMRLTVYYFIFSMIPTFRRVVKHQHHILEYLSATDLERGAIAKISRDTGTPDGTLRDWDRHRMGDENWYPLAEGHLRARALNPKSEAAISDFVRCYYC